MNQNQRIAVLLITVFPLCFILTIVLPLVIANYLGYSVEAYHAAFLVPPCVILALWIFNKAKWLQAHK